MIENKKGFIYVQCPHCNYFMSIYLPVGAEFLSYSCANQGCRKSFDARIKLIEVLEVVK